MFRSRYQKLLLPYLEGALDPKRAALLEKKLTEDPKLAAELKAMRVVTHSLRETAVQVAVQQPEPHQPVWPKVRTRLQDRSGQRLKPVRVGQSVRVMGRSGAIGWIGGLCTGSAATAFVFFAFTGHHDHASVVKTALNPSIQQPNPTTTTTAPLIVPKVISHPGTGTPRRTTIAATGVAPKQQAEQWLGRPNMTNGLRPFQPVPIVPFLPTVQSNEPNNRVAAGGLSRIYANRVASAPGEEGKSNRVNWTMAQLSTPSKSFIVVPKGPNSAPFVVIPVSDRFNQRKGGIGNSISQSMTPEPGTFTPADGNQIADMTPANTAHPGANPAVNPVAPDDSNRVLTFGVHKASNRQLLADVSAVVDKHILDASYFMDNGDRAGAMDEWLAALKMLNKEPQYGDDRGAQYQEQIFETIEKAALLDAFGDVVIGRYDPKNIDIALLRVHAALAEYRNQYDEAQAARLRMVGLAGVATAEDWYQLARLTSKMGDTAKSRADYQKAIDMGVLSPTHHADALLQTGGQIR